MKPFKISDKDLMRFMSKIDIPSNGNTDDCWIWIAGKFPNGYGQFNYIKMNTNMRAHRLAWMIHNGQHIPKGMVIMHKCDMKMCCNPNHLELGTHADNVCDMHGKVRNHSIAGMVNCLDFEKGKFVQMPRDEYKAKKAKGLVCNSNSIAARRFRAMQEESNESS